MDMSRRQFLVASALQLPPAASLMAATNGIAVEEIDPLLKDEIGKVHPVEDIARRIDPNVKICVIDCEAWAKKLTHGKGIGALDMDTFFSVWKKIDQAAKARIYKCLPETKSDAVLQASIDKGRFFSDGGNEKFSGNDGKIINVMTLGAESRTLQEFYSGLLLDDKLAQRASLASRLKVGDLSNTVYHELGHVFDDKGKATAAFSTQSVKERFYSRHTTEVRAMALESLKIAQATGDLKNIRAFCDDAMLYGFYGATSGTIDGATQYKGSRSMAYFTHKLYANVKAAFDASPDKLKKMSDAQLVALSHRVGDASVYSPEEYAALSQTLIHARLKLLQKPFSIEAKAASDDGYFEKHNDEPKNTGVALVSAAMEKRLLNRSLPYVVELEKAEQRILGLQQALNR